MKKEPTKVSNAETKISKVKAHLIKEGSINSFQAIELGCTRLSGAIFDLKSKGWRFKKSNVVLTDSHGVKATYAKYVFLSQPKKK